jgi:hypothetical protein
VTGSTAAGYRPAIVDQIHIYDLASNRLSKRDGRAGASWLGRLTEARQGARTGVSTTVRAVPRDHLSVPARTRHAHGTCTAPVRPHGWTVAASVRHASLYGPSAPRKRAVGSIPESCGAVDPHQGSVIHEWSAARRLSPQRHNVGTRYTMGRIGNEEDGKRLVTREWLQAGSSVGTRCERASCAEIIDCLRHARPSREWDLLGRELDGFGYTCHDFVRDALRQCCLKVGCKQK